MDELIFVEGNYRHLKSFEITFGILENIAVTSIFNCAHKPSGHQTPCNQSILNPIAASEIQI